MTKKKRIKNTLLVFLCILLLAAIGMIGSIHLRTNYEDLNQIDKTILDEYNAYCKSNAESAIWSDFRLEDKTIVAINGGFGNSYIINASEPINSPFAAKIKMPQDSAIQVYRVSALAPQLLAIKLEPGSFNTVGKTYSVFNNQVYFTKYEKESSVEAEYSSKHYITLLSHEAFHYYMQENWAGGNRFSEPLSATDLSLIGEEYEVLSLIQKELQMENQSRETLLTYSKQYIEIMEQRIAANPRYLKAELSMETAEGTAQYIGIQASKIVGYDYGVMYFDNQKHVSFTEVMPMLATGGIQQNFLADRMPYETGALLCELLDALSADDWQNKLNEQTKDNAVTLYSVIKDFISETIPNHGQ